jgi:hypothetical protein
MIWSLRIAFTAVLIAISVYMLLSLWRLPADAPIQRLLLRPEA